MMRASSLLGMTYLSYLITASASDMVPPTVTPVTLGGIIHQDSDDTLAFTPDHNTVFFDRSTGRTKPL